jgi:signal peptidase
MKAIKRFGSILLDIFIALVFISSTVITIITLVSNEDGIPNVNGYSPFSIQTNSMKPTMSKGDLIIVKNVDPSTLVVGDIISFYDTIDGENIIKTHRIIDIFDDGKARIYTTKGDANDTDDNFGLTEVDIVGKYIDIKIPLVGGLIDIVKSKWGFLFLVLLPLSVIFIYHLIGFIKLMVEVKLEEE